jgi:tetratricopeptide (TPR) repeat protein
MTAGKQVLQGWKEIAEYVCRDERTVKRWEKQRRLPVRRMPGAGRTNVYVLVSELDQWLSHGPSPAAQASPAKPPSRWLRMAALAGMILAVAAMVTMLRTRHAPVAAASPAPMRQVSGVPGVDDLTLRGVYLYEKRTPDSLARAEQSLQQAVAKDPGYAPAWSALAITDLLLREYGSLQDAVAYPRARSEAQRAITLDPSLADAHASLAFVLYFWDEFPTAAEQEFQAALRLNPGSALAHQWYGSVLTHEGRFAEALQQLDTAQRLEPNSTAILATRAYALGLSGHREQAIEMLNAITEQDPNYSGAHYRISVLCMAPQADISCALREQHRWAALRHDDDRLAETAAEERAYRSGGEAAMWQTALQWEKGRHPDGETMSIPVAEAALGRTDDALADLPKLVADPHSGIMGINMTIELRPLHSDPRYQRFVASLGLPQVP